MENRSKTAVVKVGRNPTESRTLIEKIHAELKQGIIRGQYRPTEKLRVEHLRQHYGVSTGTLREALTMLVADRLVISEGQRGFKVKAISPEDLIDVNRIRMLLEKEAIRESIIRGDDEWEAQVVSAYHMLKQATKALVDNADDLDAFDRWDQRHRAFHLALVSAASSEWIQDLLRLAYQQYERYRYIFHSVAFKFYEDRDAHSEHALIMDAVLARDADAAANAIEDHAKRSLDEWSHYFDELVAPEQGREPIPSRK